MFIFCLLTSALGQDNTCPKYSCKPKSMKFSQDTCIYYADDQYYLNTCSSPLWYCLPNHSKLNSTCSTPPPDPKPSLAYPGEPCKKDSDCMYPQCTNKVCVGKRWLEPCKENYECDVGLYCDDNDICWVQKGKDSRCKSDYDCQNNMGCNIFYLDDPGYCNEYYSLKSKQWVFNCQNYESNFCESGNCGGPGGKGVCIDGIKPRYLDPKCNQDEDCPGESFGWQFFSTCECGYNGDGQKYCKAFLGDYLGKLYLDSIKAWYGSAEIKKCHTDRRMSEECMGNWEGYKDYLEKLYRWKNYPQLIGNDKCVKQIFTGYYWDLQG